MTRVWRSRGNHFDYYHDSELPHDFLEAVAAMEPVYHDMADICFSAFISARIGALPEVKNEADVERSHQWFADMRAGNGYWLDANKQRIPEELQKRGWKLETRMIWAFDRRQYYLGALEGKVPWPPEAPTPYPD